MHFRTFNTYFVAFNIYLNITKKEKKKTETNLFFCNIINLIKSEAGQGGGGWQRWIKRSLNVNVINLWIRRGEGNVFHLK